MIKLIHQTWKTDQLPEAYLPQWQESWIRNHPDWDYKFWTDDDNAALVRDEYPELYKFYTDLQRGVVRSDVARVLYLHKFGGMYADLDFVCLRNFDELLRPFGDCVVLGSHAQAKQPLPNAWMYSAPGNDFWLTLLRDAERDWRAGRHKVEQIAGPDRLKWAYDKYKPESVVLPAHMIYPHTWGDTLSAITAGRLDWTNVRELQEQYNRSYAVTAWAHNW